ncbi:CysO-cysteine peptidase [bacterium HR28]|uniref:M67 family peptidase n=1 Tax=Thermomicrobium roseum TaxID=500 RepID=A0A7C1K2U9_THERO|nr:CysO-cysteine peptidase [bacterium HR28]
MIRIPREQYEAIVAHARQEAPREACGLLAGHGDRIEKVYPVPNRAELAVEFFAERGLIPPGRDYRPDAPGAIAVERFFMDPEEQFRALRAIEAAGLEHLGSYHSHPATEAYPSRTDIELAAFWPNMLLMICSLADPARPVVRAFRVVDGRVQEEDIVIEE